MDPGQLAVLLSLLIGFTVNRILDNQYSAVFKETATQKIKLLSNLGPETGYDIRGVS
jgi:hypothetical protein